MSRVQSQITLKSHRLLSKSQDWKDELLSKYLLQVHLFEIDLN